MLLNINIWGGYFDYLMDDNSQFNIFIKTFIFSSLGFGLLFPLMMSWINGDEYVSYFPEGIYAGLAFGLLFGLVISYSSKPISIKLMYDNKEDFMRKIDSFLRKDNIIPVSSEENYTWYKYQGFSIVPVLISLEILQNHVLIHGPKYFINKLSKNMVTI
jgi:hypothetical protein